MDEGWNGDALRGEGYKGGDEGRNGEGACFGVARMRGCVTCKRREEECRRNVGSSKGVPLYKQGVTCRYKHTHIHTCT